MSPEFDERDAFILAFRKAELDKREGPRVGDFVRFPGEAELRRFTHDWGDSIQTSDLLFPHGSYYLGEGYVSYSGSLDPSIKKAALTLTDEVREGKVWFFHHDQAKAHNGVSAMVTFRVYNYTA